MPRRRIIDKSEIGLPPRTFLYTIDQIATMTQISETKLHMDHIYHEGRDIGHRDIHQMRAVNMAKPEDKPDWRIADKDFIRWMKLKGFKFYDRGTITS